MSDRWHDGLGLAEDAILIDLGACPWCGEYVVEVARNGRAAGRKPPDRCCLRGTLAGVARIRAGIETTRNPEERRGLEMALSEVMRHLAGAVGAVSREQVVSAAREVEGRYALRADWNAILASIGKGR